MGVVALIFGCQPTVTLPSPPIASEAQTALLVALTPADEAPGGWPSWEGYGVASVDVIDLSSEALPSLQFGDEPTLLVQTWACRPETLGLGPGRQEPLSEGAAERTLPAPLGNHLRPVGGRWSENTTRLGPVVDHLPFVEPKPCASRGLRLQLAPPERLGLAEGTYPLFGVPLRDGTALVGTSDGQLLRADGRGQAQRLPRPTKRIRAAYPREGEELWLLDDDGALWSGPPEGPYTTAGATIAIGNPDFVTLKGNDPGEDTELYLITSHRKLARYDGIRWTVLAETATRSWGVGRGIPITELVPSLVRLGPGHVVTVGVGAADNGVYEWSQGRGTEHILPLPGDKFVRHVAKGAWSTLAATGSDRLFVSDQGRTWSSPLPTGLDTPLTVEPIGSGLLFGGAEHFAGMITGYHPSTGVCLFGRAENVAIAFLPLDEATTLILGVLVDVRRTGDDFELVVVDGTLQSAMIDRHFIDCGRIGAAP